MFVATSRVAPGGSTTIVLGTESAPFTEGRGEATFVTPDPAPRFLQAPGGTSTVAFSSECIVVNPEASSEGARVAPGGPTTIVLGEDSSDNAKLATDVVTPEPAPRFQQPPGGNSSVIFGACGGKSVEKNSGGTTRIAPGGAATIILGTDSADSFARDLVEESLITPKPATRFLQNPGGTSTINLSDESGQLPQVMSSTASRVAPGGSATIVFGDDESSRFAKEMSKSVECIGPSKAAGVSVRSSALCLGEEGCDRIVMDLVTISTPARCRK